VFVYNNGTFTKKGGGIIYGSDEDEPLKNTVSASGPGTNTNAGGHAVFVASDNRLRDHTAWEKKDLDSTKSKSEGGGWE
jgi:hypothetical protein